MTYAGNVAATGRAAGGGSIAKSFAGAAIGSRCSGADRSDSTETVAGDTTAAAAGISFDGRDAVSGISEMPAFRVATSISDTATVTFGKPDIEPRCAVRAGVVESGPDEDAAGAAARCEGWSVRCSGPEAEPVESAAATAILGISPNPAAAHASTRLATRPDVRAGRPPLCSEFMGDPDLQHFPPERTSRRYARVNLEFSRIRKVGVTRTVSACGAEFFRRRGVRSQLCIVVRCA